MLNQSKIENVPGVLASLVARGSGAPEPVAGDAALGPQLLTALAMYTHTAEPFIRITAGPRTTIVQREGDRVFAVCVTTGHPVTKSLHRMVRREATRLRALESRQNHGVVAHG